MEKNSHSPYLYVVGNENPHSQSHRLMTLLRESKDLRYNQLLASSAEMYIKHSTKLKEQSRKIETIARTKQVPEDAAYPQEFGNAHCIVTNRLLRIMQNLNNGMAIDKNECYTRLLGYFKQYEEAKEPESNIDEISSYGKFQLLCLLIQIQRRYIYLDLLMEIRKSSDSLELSHELTEKAGVEYRDIIGAARMSGNAMVAKHNKEVLEILLLEGMPEESAEEIYHGTISASHIEVFIKKRIENDIKGLCRTKTETIAEKVRDKILGNLVSPWKDNTSNPRPPSYDI